MRVIAAMGWMLGLSYQGIAGLYAALGVVISRMTSWRDVQELSQQHLAEFLKEANMSLTQVNVNLPPGYDQAMRELDAIGLSEIVEGEVRIEESGNSKNQFSSGHDANGV